MLIGEYRHTIDTKKRLALPAKFRGELGSTVVVTSEIDNCLVVYPEKEWRERSDKIAKLPFSKVEVRKFSRVVLAGAVAVNLDKLGRILIPDYLKKYAGLKKNIVFCGLNNRLEIWDVQKWEIYKKKAEKEMGPLASKLGQLGI